MMDMNFHGKTALVTGAGKGIGRAIAKKLSECGARTFALSRTQADLDSLKAEVPTIQTVQVDLRDWNKTRQVVSQLGGIDLLVNNAGTHSFESLFDITEESIDNVFAVNYKAVVNVSQIACKTMVDRGHGGSVVNISSLASLRCVAGESVYASSKAALDRMTKGMAFELGPHGIRVNAVCPNVVWTEMGKVAWSDPAKSGALMAQVPLGKFVEVEDVVNMVIFLLSDKAAMQNGVITPVDGGLTLH